MDLLERDPQLGSMNQYAAEAAQGEGRLVLVSGEAGVGKSSLVERLAQDLTDARWATGACDGLFTPRPLAPLLDIAAALGGELAELCSRGAPREQLFAEFLDDIEDASALSVFVIEDVHWADEATLDLLRFLGRRIRDKRVLLLVTYRDDGLASTAPLRMVIGELAGHRSTRRVGVPPLTEVAVRQLSAQRDVDPDELYRLTGGNPFFVTEVIRAGSASVPPSARDAVLARVARLSRPAQRLVESAALVGTRVEPTLLVRVAGAEALDEVVSAGVLTVDTQMVRFPHELARMAVAQEVPPHRRTTVHAKVLAELVASGCTNHARLAYHSEEAGDADAVQRFAPSAAAKAARLGSHREAAAQFERALRFPPVGDARRLAELYDSLADELTYIDRWPESASARESALELWRSVSDDRHEGEDQRRLSAVMWRLCRGPESQAALRRAVELLAPLGPNAELARGYAAYAFELWATDAAAALEMLDRARTMADELGDPDLRSDVSNNLACALFLRREDWVPVMREALHIALDGGAPSQAGRAYANAYTFFAADFRFAEGERFWAEGIEFCDERDIMTYSTCLRGHRAIALMDLGTWDEAAAMAQRVLATEASPVNLITSQVTLGLVRARRSLPGAMELLDAAVAEGEGVDEAEWIALTRVARAEAHWLAGDTLAALADIERARARVTAMEFHEDAMVGLWEQRLLGGARLVGRPPSPYDVQLTGSATEAAATWTELGCPYHAAVALFDEGSEESLRQALVVLDGLGATATAQVVRRRMRDLGVRSVPVGVRATTRQSPAGLTRREHEVLELVCEGHTNDEIARHLFLSVKTVDHHVSAVLGKLGVPSRRLAAREAVQRGLVTARN